ncbi:MAG: hypothetical protein R3C10_23220 [Pirellulales bacterium]
MFNHYPLLRMRTFHRKMLIATFRSPYNARHAMTFRIPIVLPATLLLPLLLAHIASGQHVECIELFGTNDFDIARDVEADTLGCVYIAGETQGALGGPTFGSGDAFLSKYDAHGMLEWTTQIGTIFNEEYSSVSVDEIGHVFASGSTAGELGGANAGQQDVFFIDQCISN